MAEITGHHYVLAVPNAQKTADFFINCLGFSKRDAGDDGWRFVARDGFRVMIGTCPDAILPSELGDHSSFAYFNVDDVDAYYEEVKSSGADIIRPIEDKPWGMREFPVKTIDGHRITVGQSLG